MIKHEDTLMQGKWQLAEKISSVVGIHLANQQYLKTTVAYGLGHDVKYAFTEHGLARTGGLLRKALQSNPGSEFVSVSRQTLEAAVNGIRSSDLLFGKAEVLRRIDVVMSGFFPSEWRDNEYDGCDVSQFLQPLTNTVYSLAHSYSALVREAYGGTEAPTLVLRRLDEGSIIDTNGYQLCNVRVPGFKDDSSVAGSLALLVGLQELARNAFRHLKDNVTLFKERAGSNSMSVWTSIDQAADDALRVRIVNPSLSSAVRSKSLEHLRMIAQRLGAIELDTPRQCATPPYGDGRLCYVEGTFWLYPQRISWSN
jgi:hypothetical protein